MTRSLVAAALALVLGVGVVTPAFSQDAKPAEAPKPQAGKEEPKKEEPKKDQKTLDYEKAVKDLKRIDGPFPLYLRRKEILLELPEDKLGKLFLMQATFHHGVLPMIVQAGEPINNIDIFRFDRAEEAVYLVRPNTRYRWSEDNSLRTSAERSMPEAILASYRIEQTNPEKKLLLVNVTNLFMGDLFRINEMVGMLVGGAYQLDREKTSVETTKGFEKNTVLRMRKHYFSPRGAAEQNPLLALLGLSMANMLEDDRSVPLKVTYNVSWREETGYVPRFYDPRVGYFTQDFYSVDKFFLDNQTERLIYRWNLKKKDPKAAMSEPVKPIVWTLDPSIPEKYRPAVREGVLRWNKAFERLGFKNAVRVQDVPKDDADYDHADGRYNVIRWTMSEDAAYAVAQVRTDPLTGEILNAAVTFDASMLTYVLNEHVSYATPSSSTMMQCAHDVLIGNEPKGVQPDRWIFEHEQVKAESLINQLLQKSGWRRKTCNHAMHLAADAGLKWAALKSMGGGMRISAETYAKEFIADVISHEVGHCLGLRHNFVASTQLTTEQLANDKLIDEKGITASVMDYTPTNVMAVLRGQGRFFAPTIGTYDKWAIEYGYREIPNVKKPMDEILELRKIASRSGLPGHAYLTDEDADAFDPFAVRFDNAKDPVNYAAREIEAARRAERYAIEQLPRPGENYTRRTQLIVASVTRRFRQGQQVARFVGGLSMNRNFRGDANERPTLTPVDAATQRQAMRLIASSLLAKDAFRFSPDVLNRMSLGPDANEWQAPVRTLLSSNQSGLVGLLLSAERTNRIAENAFKAGAKGYGLDEHYGLVLGAVFSEVGKNESIAPVRRDLQRFTVNALISQAGATGSVNEDVRMIASDSLRRLSARFGQQLQNGVKLDGMSRLHLRDTKANIDRFLARQIATPR